MDKINKAVFSFWSKPFFIQNASRNFGGFNTLTDFYNSWILAVCSAVKIFKEVELITDKKGLELLSKLNLPFTNIKVELDCLNHIHHDIWAIGKLYTYYIQDKPFVHLDYDFYLFDNIIVNKNDADFIAQEVEGDYCTFYNGILYKYIDSDLKIDKNITKYLFNTNKIYALNCGIFGGFNIEKIKYYAKTAMDIGESINNANIYNEYDIYGSESLLIEQHLVGMIAKNYNISVHTILNKIKFTHLLSSAKRHPDNMLLLRNNVNHFYKQYTNNI